MPPGRLDTVTKTGEQAAQDFHHDGKAAALVAFGAAEWQQCAALAARLDAVRIRGLAAFGIDDPAQRDLFAFLRRQRNLAERDRRRRHVEIERPLKSDGTAIDIGLVPSRPHAPPNGATIFGDRPLSAVIRPIIPSSIAISG